MIIIEGPDNCGKTTLFNQLIKYVNGLDSLGHSNGPPKSEQEFYSRLFRILSRAKKNSIIDRFPVYSEGVYGGVLKGRDYNIPSIYLNLFDNLLSTVYEPLIILCILPLEDIKSTFNEREQLDGVRENLNEIYKQYHNLFRYHKNVVYYDYTVDSLDVVMDKVKKYLSL